MDSNGIFENAGALITIGIILIGLYVVMGRGTGLMTGIVLVVVLCAGFPHDPLAQLALRFILNIIIPLIMLWGLFRMVAGRGNAGSRK